MRLLIDTCNVLHRTGILPPDLAGVDERGLAALIAQSRYASNHVLLVCDGTSGRGRRSKSTNREANVHFRYAGPRLSADELILQLVKASSAPRSLLVVSSDRAIGVQAKRRKCRIMDADSFLSQLAHDAESRPASRQTMKPPTHEALPQDEVEDWLKHFDLDDEHDQSS